MSLLFSQPPKLCLKKHTLARSSPLLPTGFSTTLLQTPPCCVVSKPWENLKYAYYTSPTSLEKDLPLNVIINDALVMIGSSHGWVATLKKDDGIVRLQDDLNPVASVTDPKRISLPPLVTLPDCQTQIVTNMAMSSSSPDQDEDCVVAVKFLGPQLSFCRPAQRNSEWINIRISNPCFFSSHVMFSEKHNKFRIPGSGGHLIGSWDLHKNKHNPKFQRLKFLKLPKLTETKRELLHSCCTSEHLVEARSTGETFMVKWYKKTAEIVDGIAKMKTEGLMVFKLDEEGNAVYTQDIGDLSLYLSNSEPFCVSPSSFPSERPNVVRIVDTYEFAYVNLDDSSISSVMYRARAPYFIPPQNIVF